MAITQLFILCSYLHALGTNKVSEFVHKHMVNQSMRKSRGYNYTAPNYVFLKALTYV